MKELEVYRKIINAIDECEYKGKPLRQQLEGAIGVEQLATIVARSFTKQGLVKLDDQVINSRSLEPLRLGPTVP